MDGPDFAAVSAVYKGTSPIQRIFRGELLIWEAGTTYKAGSADAVLLILQDAAAMQTEAELASTVSEILAAQDAVGMELPLLLGSQRVALLLMQSAAAMRMESVKAGTPRDLALGQDAEGEANGIVSGARSSGIALGSPAEPDATQIFTGSRASGLGIGNEIVPAALSSGTASQGSGGAGTGSEGLEDSTEDIHSLSDQGSGSGQSGEAYLGGTWAIQVGSVLTIRAAAVSQQTGTSLAVE